MTFKLPSLKGKSYADKSLACHGLPLFQWGNLRGKEDSIGRRTFGLVFVTRNGHGEKVVIRKLLSEDDVAYFLKHFLIDFSARRQNALTW